MFTKLLAKVSSRNDMNPVFVSPPNTRAKSARMERGIVIMAGDSCP